MDYTTPKVQIENYKIKTSLSLIMENLVNQNNWNFNFRYKNSSGHNIFSFEHIRNYKKCMHICIFHAKEIDGDS